VNLAGTVDDATLQREAGRDGCRAIGRALHPQPPRAGVRSPLRLGSQRSPRLLGHRRALTWSRARVPGRASARGRGGDRLAGRRLTEPDGGGFGSGIGAGLWGAIRLSTTGSRPIAGLMSLLGTALVLLALTEDVRLVASGLTVGGIMLGALFAALSACVAGPAPRERAVESFGWFGAAGSVGAALSLVAGGYSIEAAGASAGW
jgi:hypothetical protein